MFKYTLCLIITSVMCLRAVTVQNNTPYRIRLEDFSLISDTQRELPHKILKPGATFSQNDIARFTIYAKSKSHNVEDLKDDDYIIVTWTNNDLVVEFYDSTTTIHAKEGQEVLCYNEEQDMFHVIVRQ